MRGLKRLIQSAVGVTILALFLLATGNVDAQQQRQGMKGGMGQGQMGAGMGQGMMGNMPPGMKVRQRLMMNMAFDQFDPQVLTVFKDELGLTSEQLQGMEKILKEARKQAAELLTPEQKASLQQLGISSGPPADMPNPMMQQGKSKKPMGRGMKKPVDE